MIFWADTRSAPTLLSCRGSPCGCPKLSKSKNLLIFFVAFSLSISNSILILSKIYLILSCSESIFMEFKYSHKTVPALKTIGQLIQK
ncbi:hypothetical protein ACFLY2_03565 [Patescibacteria group bacterium]